MHAAAVTASFPDRWDARGSAGDPAQTVESGPAIGVLALHSSDELYGSDRVFYDLVTRLDRTRFRTVVVLPKDVPGGGELSRRLQASGLEVRQRKLAVLRRRYLRPLALPVLSARLLRDVVGLIKLARSENCALVYSNTTAVQGGALAACLMRRPHVWHLHEIVESPRLIATLLKRSVSSLSTEVVAPSQAVADWAACSTDHITVIHNGLSDAMPAPATRAALRRRLLRGRPGPLVGWASRVSPWKGHQVFVDMAETWAAHHANGVFVLAGGPVPGNEELVAALRERICRSPFSDRIDYLGLVPEGPLLVSSLDVLVSCPTRPDPFPRVVQEALWQGVPVLAVRTGGIPELVTDGQTGLLVEVADGALLAEALGRILEPYLWQALSTEARHASIGRFGVEAFVDRMTTILSRAHASRRSTDRCYSGRRDCSHRPR